MELVGRDEERQNGSYECRLVGWSGDHGGTQSQMSLLAGVYRGGIVSQPNRLNVSGTVQDGGKNGTWDVKTDDAALADTTIWWGGLPIYCVQAVATSVGKLE
jgi:hypothetical protein